MDENLNRPIHNRFQQEPSFIEVSDEPQLESRQIIANGQMISGKFRVIKLLGRGANGTVYQVEQILLKQEFAMKILDPVTVTDESWRRFQKEAQAAARLDHVAFVKVYDFGVLESGAPFFTMDLVRGDTLALQLQKNGPFKLNDALPIFVQLCIALDHAHTKGIIHRDLKPSNIASYHDTDTTDGVHVKILDFGIAKLVGSDATAMTQAGSVFGTPFYMSPEQCVGDVVDQRSDIYSLGCLFFELLTGAPPFTTANPLTLMMQHQTERPPSLKEASMGEEFPRALESILQKMLAKNPNERYQNLSVTANDLMSLQRGKVVTLPSEENIPKLVTVEKQKNSVLLYISLALTAVIIFLTGVIGVLYAKYHEAVVDKSLPPRKPVDALFTTKEETSYITRKPYFSEIVPVKYGFEERTFNFPTKWSLGRIKYKKENGQDVECDAVGSIKIRAFPGQACITGLAVNWLTIGVCPQLLSKFRPDEIGGVDFAFDQSQQRIGDIEDIRCFNDALYFIRDYKKIYGLINLQPDTTDDAFDDLNKLTTLRYLLLGGTKMTGEKLQNLACLPTLKEFRGGGIKHCALILPHFLASGQMSNQYLEKLYLPLVDLQDSDLQYIGRFEKLSELMLRDNARVTDEGLKHLINLHLNRLVILGCNITPNSIDTLKQMNIKDKLLIDVSKWPVNEIARLREAVKPCVVVTQKEERQSERKGHAENKAGEIDQEFFVKSPKL